MLDNPQPDHYTIGVGWVYLLIKSTFNNSQSLPTPAVYRDSELLSIRFLINPIYQKLVPPHSYSVHKILPPVKTIFIKNSSDFS